MQMYQTTLARSVYAEGVGLHTGRPAELVLHPAPAGSGVRFLRADLAHAEPIPALSTSIMDTRLATTIAKGAAFVSTTEHLLSALYALGIDNVLVEVNGPEVPIFDGSAARFVDLVREAGVRELTAPRSYLVPTAPVEIAEGDKWIRLEPLTDGLEIDCSIDFAHVAIGAQRFQAMVDADSFVFGISRARTFGFLRELEALQSSGLGLGGSLENAVVLDDDKVVNPEGLRFTDEFVRHKALDLLGDLALIGLPLLGRVTSHKSGHALNGRLTRYLVDNPGSWERFVPAVPDRLVYAAR